MLISLYKKLGTDYTDYTDHTDFTYLTQLLYNKLHSRKRIIREIYVICA